MVLKFDRESERVSLGYKQLKADPWTTATIKYPAGARVKGKVVSLTDYGAFVELEEGVEGLIHVSEMSWSKKVKHPSKILTVGQEVECAVLGIDQEAHRISLGLKQVESNPWEQLVEKYPVGSQDQGQGPQPHRVRRVRRGRGGHRRPDPHLRPVLDQARQAPLRGPEEGRHRRGRRPQHRRREPAPVAGPEAARHRHLGRVLRAPQGRRHRRGQDRPPDELRRLRRAGTRASRAWCTSPSSTRSASRSPRSAFKPGDVLPDEDHQDQRGREEDRPLHQGGEAGRVPAGPARPTASRRPGSDRSHDLGDAFRAAAGGRRRRRTRSE